MTEEADALTQSAEIVSALQRAQRAFHEGRMEAVESECRAVIGLEPDNAEAWVLLSTVARHHGHLADAAEMMRRAAQLRPDNRHMRIVLGSIYLQMRDWRNAQPIFQRLQESDPDPEHVNALAKCDWGLGRYDKGLAGFKLAAEEAPDNAGLRVGLAQALISLWRLAEAREALAPLAGKGTRHAKVWVLLSRLAFRDGQPGEALAFSERAVGCPDATADVHLNHAALLKLAGRTRAAEDAHRQVPRTPRPQAQWESFEYALSHRPPARLYGFGNQVLEHALQRASVKGLTLEFGVYHGRSLRLIAERVRSGVHGFDSFQGLPEDWTPNEPAGSYSTGGRKPEVPGHVELHAGRFEDTLPALVEAHREPVRLAHVDCDLYSSTRTVLEHIRPLLREGTILVFDDYLGYPGWHEHEFRAFAEFTRETGLKYRYLGFGLLDRQAAVELTRIGT